MGKTITNPDGSRTRVSSSGRKFNYPRYGGGGESPILYGNITPESLDNLKWPKGYIENPERRQQHLKDTYFNMLDSNAHPKEALENLQRMSGYGSERGGIATQGASWGFDHKDIVPKQIDTWLQEYIQKRFTTPKKEYKNAGRIKRSYC